MTTEPRQWTEADDKALSSLADKIRRRDEKLQASIYKGKMEIAKWLMEAQALLAVPGCKSQFGPWVESLEIDLKKSSAYNYIDVYKCFGNCEHVAQFAWTAMIKLAGDDKQDARNAALKVAEQGERITGKVAKELIAEHCPQGSEAAADSLTSEDSQEQPQEAAETATPAPTTAATAARRESGDSPARGEPFVYYLGDSRIILEPAFGVDRIELHKQAAAYLFRWYEHQINKSDEIGARLKEVVASLDEKEKAAA